jgi:hypothetical protein
MLLTMLLLSAATAVQLRFTLNALNAEEVQRTAASAALANATNELAATARSQLGTDPALSGLLAVRAAQRAPTQSATDALRAVVPALHQVRTASS